MSTQRFNDIVKWIVCMNSAPFSEMAFAVSFQIWKWITKNKIICLFFFCFRLRRSTNGFVWKWFISNRFIVQYLVFLNRNTKTMPFTKLIFLSVHLKLIFNNELFGERAKKKRFEIFFIRFVFRCLLFANWSAFKLHSRVVHTVNAWLFQFCCSESAPFWKILAAIFSKVQNNQY